MKRVFLIIAALALLLPTEAKKKQTVQQTDREYWVSLAWKLAQPVLENMAKGELQKNMQTEFSPSFESFSSPPRMCAKPSRPGTAQ